MNHYLYNPTTKECWGPYPTRAYAEHYYRYEPSLGRCEVITELELTEEMRQWRKDRLRAA